MEINLQTQAQIQARAVAEEQIQAQLNDEGPIHQCSEKKRKLCGRIKCIPCYNKSFYKLEKDRGENYSIKWDYNNNNGIHPLQVHKNTMKDYNFFCYICKQSLTFYVKFITQGFNHGDVFVGICNYRS